MSTFHAPLWKPASLGIAVAVVLGLGACGGAEDDATPSAASATTANDTSTDEASTESSSTAGNDANTSTGDEPDWAEDITTPGDKLTTLDVGDVSVAVYQVDVTESPKEGNQFDKDTKEPIIAEGDDIVYVNYVATNHGDPIDLGSSLVDVQPRYEDWKYIGGMDTITDSDLDEEMDINRQALTPGESADPPVYTLGKNESISFGENFKYQKNSPITFKAEYVPVDDEGELQHDDKVEGSADTKIK